MASHPELYNGPLVALDLETTGLDLEQDEIIEVGAVRFQGREVLDTYSTLVNPYRPVPPYVQRLTGISTQDVQSAPPLAAIAGELEEFLGDAPLIGHNVGFDVGFLDQKRIRHSGVAFDTWDLAFTFLPYRRGLALGHLAGDLGITHDRPHRALEDADVTRGLFLALLDIARTMPVETLEALHRLAARSHWTLERLLANLLAERERQAVPAEPVPGATGLDLEALRNRLSMSHSLRPAADPQPVSVEALERMLSSGGAVEQVLPGYQQREEQVRMMRRVASALNEGQHLLVEGGTGIGKSLAYLLPAALFALENDACVVISTNTINLQEQLLSKDIPLVQEALEREEMGRDLKAACLKGRSNYLCLRRWAHLSASESLTREEARLLARVRVWLQSTSTGDRSEMTMPPREERLWERISARNARECSEGEQVCFLRAAREQARGAHILVVNHALLLSDAAMGGSLLPEYHHLIIDEAHHLEPEATRQFGFGVSEDALLETLETAGGQRGLVQQVRAFLSRQETGESRRERLEEELATLERGTTEGQVRLGRLFRTLRETMEKQSGASDEGGRQFLITPQVRTQPGWSRMEAPWQEVDETLATITRSLERLQETVRELAEVDRPLANALWTELGTRAQDLGDGRIRLREILVQPLDGTIYWASQRGREGTLGLDAAPLETSDLLQAQLYEGKTTVVLTGATLTSSGNFDYFRQRVGMDDAHEHREDSPFDYQHRVLLLAARDMPRPGDTGYTRAVARALADLARAARGHTMALFTSYSSLRATARELGENLGGDSIQVLAQGTDGSPQRILEQFQDHPRSVLLGTSSFWEGIDVPNGLLKVLVVARLPFNVPTDPVFASRSQLFENPFLEYAVPQAILRFRQGFGRLIRRHDDKGAVVVLDSRLVKMAYGKSFLNSIPECTLKTPNLGEMASEVMTWLEATP